MGISGSQDSLEALLEAVPAVRPQQDGVIFLGVEAAAIVHWSGSQPRLAWPADRLLRVAGGRIVAWSGDVERPCWKFEVPQAGPYRVALSRSAASGRESTVTLFLRGPRERRLTRRLDPTGDGDAAVPCVLGDVDLGGGAHVLELRPLSWNCPREIMRLESVRLVPLGALKRDEAAVLRLMDRPGIVDDPAVRDLSEKVRALRERAKTLNDIARQRDFGGFTDFGRFLEFDGARAGLARVQADLEAAEAGLREARKARLKALSGEGKLGEEEARKAESFLRADTAVSEGLSKACTGTTFVPPPPPERRTLFPTGKLESLPLPDIDLRLPRVELAFAPPPDAGPRLERFARRNGDEGLADLCRKFRSVLIPGTAGLEAFERHAREGRPREALEAYRDYFFRKLSDPGKYGAATENILFELTRDRGKGHLLKAPLPQVVEMNVRGWALGQVREEVVAARVGLPGAVCWAPPDLKLPEGVGYSRGGDGSPFWRTPEGRDLARRIEFLRGLRAFPSDREEYFSLGFFPALLSSYAATGNREHLDLWCGYADDWAIHGRRDLDECPVDLRRATELETQPFRCMLTLLRILLDERPGLAAEFDPATLARLLMAMAADFPPYLIRARRAEMANWGNMGICHLLHVAAFLYEFKAMEYFNREAWRLARINFIQHRTLDGENIEAWDEGHNPVDIEYAVQSVPFARLDGLADGLDLADYWDQVRVNQRSLLTHITPAGRYWPPGEADLDLSAHSLRKRYLRPDSVGRTFLDLVEGEEGARRRIETIMSGGNPPGGAFPDRTSDVAPYAGMAYLRDSWQPGADFLLLQNFRDRSQSLADCPRTGCSLSRGGRVLAELHSLAVDRKPDNRFAGKGRTGGKTGYCAQAGRNTTGERFHASARFDFAEAVQDAPYALPEVPTRDLFGLYGGGGGKDPDPITDVTVLRRVFHPKGSGLWIVCDRIDHRGPAEREYTQFVMLPARLMEAGLAERIRLLSAAGHELVQEEPSLRRVRTANPGLENVSIRFFGGGELRFANQLDRKRQHEAFRETATAALARALAAAKSPERFLKDYGDRLSQRPVSARFSGRGRQVFVTVLHSIPAAADLKDVFQGDLRRIEESAGTGGAIGFRAELPDGTEVAFQAGPAGVQPLAAGPVRAEGGALLTVRPPGGAPVRGIALGCRNLGPGPNPDLEDFEFELDAQGGVVRSEAIRRPIDTVRILPAENVFVEQTLVSFDIPGLKDTDVELRYTLDGSEPTLQSPLYRDPIPLHETARVKVRPFRRGLTGTPWHFTGTDAGRTVSAIFRKQPLLPPAAAGGTEAGLAWEYFEGDWPTLFAYAGCEGVLEPRSRGTGAGLLDAAHLERIRRTDRAFAVRYEGYLRMPRPGVYGIHVPPHLYTPTLDAGYDLRVFVDGREWSPAPALHAENVWYVPLEAGPHRLKVAYVDYRWKTFRNEYWMRWQPEEMGTGVPTLEISGPGMDRRPVPVDWLTR
jgi:hypothetical protein